MAYVQQHLRRLQATVAAVALLLVAAFVVCSLVVLEKIGASRSDSKQQQEQLNRQTLRRRLLLQTATASAAAASAAAAAVSPNEDTATQTTSTSTSTSNTRRPIIHTFYNPLLEDVLVTGMTNDGDEALLEAWKEAWWEAGFEPRILTLEDAKSHPDYIPLDYAMSHTWLDGYNKMCIFRWVAMSNVGGGWMSDYDLFPLGTPVLGDENDDTIQLPNNGILTVHDRFVPDLVSGSADEWIRVAKEIVAGLLEKDAKKKVEAQAYPPKKKQRRIYTLWTDMLALHQWWSEAQMNGVGAIKQFESDSRVMDAFNQEDEGLGVPWSPEKCKYRTPSPGIMAVHFSHSTIKRGITKKLLHEGQTLNDRAAIAKEFLATWKASCMQQS
jgi:hypothetical protein